MTEKQKQYFKSRKIVHLTLGKHYVIWWDWRKKMICKLIKPTKKGFNFLNINTNKCILPNHLYLKKGTKQTFYINQNLKIN